jgi:hypothetical protein
LYLASFGEDLVKCGVTKSERVEKRLKEQGADYWCELMRFDNGENAYNTETELQNRFALKNFVRNDVKLRLLGKAKSKDLLGRKLEEIKASGEFSDRIIDCSIRKNNFNEPEKFEVTYSVDGKISGCKGNLLFFERDSDNFVVPMHKAIGRVFLLKE